MKFFNAANSMLKTPPENTSTSLRVCRSLKKGRSGNGTITSTRNWSKFHRINFQLQKHRATSSHSSAGHTTRCGETRGWYLTIIHCSLKLNSSEVLRRNTASAVPCSSGILSHIYPGYRIPGSPCRLPLWHEDSYAQTYRE